MTAEDQRIIKINVLVNQLRYETAKRDKMQVELCASMKECIALRNQLKALGYTWNTYQGAA